MSLWGDFLKFLRTERRVPTYVHTMTITDKYPATGEQIVAYFRTWDHDNMWAENWHQGPNEPIQDPGVSGTITTIQGVVCCVDQDDTIAWLLMVCDCVSGSTDWTVSYICMTFSRLPTWKWAWIRTDDTLDACREFITWLELNDEYAARSSATRP